MAWDWEKEGTVDRGPGTPEEESRYEEEHLGQSYPIFAPPVTYTLFEQAQEDAYITTQTFQDTRCKDYFLTELDNLDNDLSFEPSFLWSQSDRYPFVTDKLRAKTGNYWTHYTATNNGEEQNALTYFRKTFKGFVPINLFFTPTLGLPELEEGELFPSITENIVLSPAVGQFLIMTKGQTAEGGQFNVATNVFDPSAYESFINNMVTLGTEFTDHTCVVNALYSQKEISNMAAGSALCYAEIEGHYNTYIKSYEKIISKEHVKEWTLPNLYAFYLMKHEEVSRDFKDLITMLWAPNIEKTVGNNPQGEYYTEYAIYRNDPMYDTFIPLNKWKNIIVPYEDAESNIAYNENANLFPMSVNINFKTDSRTEFAELLKDSQLSTIFIKYIAHLLEEDNDFTTAMSTWEYGVERNIGNIIKKIDLTDYIKNAREATLSNIPQSNAALLGLLREEPIMDEAEDYSIILSLLAAIFYAKINDSVTNHFRTFREVLAGKPAYSETVLYKITKYDPLYKTIETESGEEKEILDELIPIQSIYLPNSNNIDVHQYVDTQVKFGKTYYYKIFGYEMVIGNKYEYTELDMYDSDKAKVTVKHTPSIQLLETELFGKAISILDHPPMAPEVYMIPFKGVNNKIRHLINNSIGQATTQPIALTPGELTKYDNYREATGLEKSNFNTGFPGDDIIFKSDDIPQKFEIYRMTTRPEKYKDFAGHFLKRIWCNLDVETKVSSVACDDHIQPNQKYYYMFRSIDVHNHISLPSEVYEVEMVDDEGVVYPIIKAIELKEQNMNIISKSFKRFLKIKPATSQIFFDDTQFENEDTAPTNGVNLGLASPSVWEQKFRVRLTSRQTGKKIDINFKFKHNHKQE